MLREGQSKRGAGQTIRIWLGYCEGSAEDSLEVSDETVTVPFGLMPTGEPLLPLVDSLAEIWQVQIAQARATPLQEGPAPSTLDNRLASLEATVATLAASLARPDGAPETQAQALLGMQRVAKGSARKPEASNEASVASFPGLDKGVVTAALAGGVQPRALQEMSRLVSTPGPMGRLKPEPEKGRASAHQDPLEESEDDARGDASLLCPEVLGQFKPRPLEAGRSIGKRLRKVPRYLPHRRLNQEGLLGESPGRLRRCFSRELLGRREEELSCQTTSSRSPHPSPHEISSIIENLMAEDLSASTPGVGSPPLTSSRAWLEHRSKVQAFPTMVHLSWAIAGALDCLRAGQTAQARARLNIALLQADQTSVDKGNWLLSQELALEPPPPMASFRRHEAGQRRTPGSEAPGLALPALWNSLPRLFLRSAGPFAAFLRSSLRSGGATCLHALHLALPHAFS